MSKTWHQKAWTGMGLTDGEGRGMNIDPPRGAFVGRSASTSLVLSATYHSTVNSKTFSYIDCCIDLLHQQQYCCHIRPHTYDTIHSNSSSDCHPFCGNDTTIFTSTIQRIGFLPFGVFVRRDPHAAPAWANHTPAKQRVCVNKQRPQL